MENNNLWRAYVNNNTRDFSDKAFRQWPEEGSTSTGGWVQTAWHQNAPYNDLCPLDPDTGTRCPAGCIVTAMAQIVNYHKYIGDLSFSEADAYQSSNIQIDADSPTCDFPSFDQLNGYLSSLRYKYNHDIPIDGNDIAALNFACGISTHTNYNGFNSTATHLDAKNGFLNKFNCTAERKEAGESDFYGILKSNIINAQPAQLGIRKDYESSHSVVCDGYNTEGYYHLNFGWGPNSPNDINTAWYYLPEGMPTGYTMIHYCVVNIKPIIPELSIDPMIINFGAEHIGNTSEFVTLTLLNEKDSVVTIDSITAPYGFAIKQSDGDYSNSIGSFDINPALSENIYVVFSPTDATVCEGVLEIRYRDPNEKDSYITLIGTGITDGTIIPSGPVSGIWSEPNSPYYINGDIHVADNNALIVDPGVKIVFSGHYKMDVRQNATLIAEGTEENKIEFTALDRQIGWYGLRFKESGADDIIRHCIFSYAKKSAGLHVGPFSTEDASGSAIFIESNIVDEIDGSIIIRNRTTIANCTFINNHSLSGPGFGTVAFRGGTHEGSILNNTFLYNDGGAIEVGHFHGKCVIANNMICANNGEGIDIQECNAIVVNNVIANNSTGYAAAIVCANKANANLVNNTIVNNENTGIIANWDSRVFVYNNILLGHENPIIKGETGVINTSYSLVEGAYPGPGNIEEEPVFINPTTNMGLEGYFADADFHLDKCSPCINAGDPNYLAGADEVDIDGDARIIARRIDIGADEFSYAELSDLNSDGTVDFKDFDVLAYYWMDCVCSEPDWCEGSDFNRSSIVDLIDLFILAENWLRTP